MKLKLLQLNIWKGAYLKQIIDFVRHERFDVLTFQEVTAGIASSDKKSNIFTSLKKELPMEGMHSLDFGFTEDPSSFFGNAIFYNPSFDLLKKEEIKLTPTLSFSRNEKDWTKASRTALRATFAKDGHSFTIVTTHGAWSPIANDTEEKIRQGHVLFSYLKTIAGPLVLTGDFNVVSDTKIMQTYEKIATNLTKKHNVQNTLNSRIHYAKHLFPPGLAVDHVLVTPHVVVDSFRIVDDIDLSDHLGIALELKV